MKPGPKKGFGKKARYSMEELFQIWVIRKRCSKCGGLFTPAALLLHQDFCGRKVIVQPRGAEWHRIRDKQRFISKQNRSPSEV